jgi:hypothetical protein
MLFLLHTSSTLTSSASEINNLYYYNVPEEFRQPQVVVILSNKVEIKEKPPHKKR